METRAITPFGLSFSKIVPPSIFLPKYCFHGFKSNISVNGKHLSILASSGDGTKGPKDGKQNNRKGGQRNKVPGNYNSRKDNFGWRKKDSLAGEDFQDRDIKDLENENTGLDFRLLPWLKENEKPPWGKDEEIIGDGGILLNPIIEKAKLADPRERAKAQKKILYDKKNATPDPPAFEGSVHGIRPYIPPKRRHSSYEKSRRKYTYGEHGPYKGRPWTMGKPGKVNFDLPTYATASSIRHDRDQEAVDQVQMKLEYSNAIDDMDDDNIGIKHYFVFVRQTGGEIAPEKPWEDWTLVSQLAVESKEYPNKWRIASFLSADVRSKIGQCTGWFRPDLIYVENSRFEARFEPQFNFFEGLVPLLEPSPNPLLSKIMAALGLFPGAARDEVLKKFEEEDDATISKVLRVIFDGRDFTPFQPYELPEEEKRAREAEMEASSEHSSSGAMEEREESSSESELPSMDEMNGRLDEAVSDEWILNAESEEAGWEQLLKTLQIQMQNNMKPKPGSAVEEEDNDSDSNEDTDSADWSHGESEEVGASPPPQFSVYNAIVCPYTYKDLLDEILFVSEQMQQ